MESSLSDGLNLFGLFGASRTTRARQGTSRAGPAGGRARPGASRSGPAGGRDAVVNDSCWSICRKEAGCEGSFGLLVK